MARTLARWFLLLLLLLRLLSTVLRHEGSEQVVRVHHEGWSGRSWLLLHEHLQQILHAGLLLRLLLLLLHSQKELLKVEGQLNGWLLLLLLVHGEQRLELVLKRVACRWRRRLLLLLVVQESRQLLLQVVSAHE